MPRLHAMRERLGRIITCPVGQSCWSRAGWDPLQGKIIVSMTLLPTKDWMIPSERERLLSTNVSLTINDKIGYMEAPALILMHHYLRRHGPAAVDDLTAEALASYQKALKAIGKAWEDSDDRLLAAFVELWRTSRATVLESRPCVVMPEMDVYVKSSAPIDALAVLEVSFSRDWK